LNKQIQDRNDYDVQMMMGKSADNRQKQQLWHDKKKITIDKSIKRGDLDPGD
jgi:hypothetical protein